MAEFTRPKWHFVFNKYVFGFFELFFDFVESNQRHFRLFEYGFSPQCCRSGVEVEPRDARSSHSVGKFDSGRPYMKSENAPYLLKRQTPLP